MAVTALPMPEPDDETIVVDLDVITLGEFEEMEDHFGKSSADLMREMRTSTMRYLAYLTRRRTDPSYTYEDTASLTMSQVRMGEVDPTDDGGSGS
jgi:hypothetical protein